MPQCPWPTDWSLGRPPPNNTVQACCHTQLARATDLHPSLSLAGESGQGFVLSLFAYLSISRQEQVAQAGLELALAELVEADLEL